MKLKGLMLAVAGALALVSAPQANATVSIKLTNGATTVIVADGSAQDSCAIANCVTFNGSIGNYLINVSTGIANNTVNPFLDLNSVNLAIAGNAGVLTIATSYNGYTTSAPNFLFQVGGTSSLGGPTSFSAYGGNTNTLFDTSHLIGSMNFASSPYSNTVVGGGSSVNPYSLTIVASLTGVTAGAASFDAAIDAVPEPVSVSMLGGVLLLSATAIRRKLSKTA
jgi:hypothetical protein